MNSHPDETRYRELAQKWLDGTITAAEKQEFAAWYNADQDAPVDIPSKFAESEDALRERILNKINSEIFDETSGHCCRSDHSKQKAISIATSISLVIAIL